MTTFSRFNTNNSNNTDNSNNTNTVNNTNKKNLLLVFTHILTFSFGVITMHLFMKYQN